MRDSHAKNIDEYISGYSEEIQAILQKIRRAIKKAAPSATEAIAYGMPTFRLNGNLVHFAAQKQHIGFYPTPSGVDKFREELSSYKTSKGAVQFPLSGSIPYDLIERITKFRVKENLARE